MDNTSNLIQTIIVGLPSDRVTLHEELAKLYSAEVVRVKTHNFEETKKSTSDSQVSFIRLNPAEIVKRIFRDPPVVSRELAPFDSIFHIKMQKQNRRPLSIGVAILHYERPHLLQRAIRSVLNQTRIPDEILVCDDGSKSNESVDLLNSLKSENNNFNQDIKIVQNKNLYLGALRNKAAETLQTDLIFFLDDDNVMHPTALEKFEAAYKSTNSEIIGSYQSRYYQGAPSFLGDTTYFTGVGVLGTAKKNWIADGNCLIDREFFIKTDGNSEIHSVGADDHEFFTKAQLMGGTIEIIPEKLIACQQLRLRLRNSQVRQDSKGLRVSEAFSNNANVIDFSEIGRRPVLNVDKVLFQRYILAHRQNAPFF